MKEKKCFFLVSLILSFQIFRNLNLIIYMIILIGAYFLLGLNIFNKKFKLKKINLKEFLFIATYIWTFIITFYYSTPEDLRNIIPRYLITFFIIIYYFFILNKNDFSLSKNLKKIIIFITCLSAGSIFYQIQFGQIKFFAKASMREGLVRYSSFAGSLTIYGTISAFALYYCLINDEYSKVKKMLISSIIISGTLVSLQKSGIVNIALVLILYFILNKKFNVLLYSLLIIILGTIILGSSKGFFMIYTDKILNYTFNSNLIKDFFNRQLILPLKVYEYHRLNISNLFLGVGLKTLAGTMGVNYYPMAHNNYFDLIYSGGIFHLVAFIMLLLEKISKKNIIPLILIIINMLIGAFTMYQPLYCIVFLITLLDKRLIIKEGV